ncbi:DUF2637 domain-containing protein [Kitasatospora cinereorecta]|uniref:DUF2637 domain-containing protein n=1 Tax=Kitasatospora cinereorecta TaxID=285560 RepID=A0ABW0VM86_9ACTN
MARPSLTRAHRALLGVVAAGACVISGIGFAGSYNAVRELALQKGFGAFSYAFPIGVDAGIVVLLALDLVLTWLRIPFPLLRQTAWLLTAATIAFNAAASWGDALGMAMHAVIPVLFVVVVEASRHAVGRIAAITADRYMESVRLMRWVLSPVPTFRLWRRMKLWELRSYDETVRLEQNRLVYRAQLRFRYGRGWRRSAPFQALLPLKLAKYGVPLDPGILDRIDGPLEANHAMAGAALEAGGQQAVSAVSAAVAVPTLAKLAAVRLRDAQDPQAAEPGVAHPAADEVNDVWTSRAVRMSAEQSSGEEYGARVPGQASPWFKPPRVTRPGTAPVAPAQSPRPQQSQQSRQSQQTQLPRQARPAQQELQDQQAQQRRIAQMVQEQQRRMPEPPLGAVDEVEAEPILIGHRPMRLDGEMTMEQEFPLPSSQAAHAEPLPFDGAEGVDGADDAGQDAAGGRRGSAEPLDLDLCYDALIGYIDTYDHHPTPEIFAEYLTHEVGMVGSRPNGSVGPRDLESVWTKLQDRYVTSGRD